jgi:hypothetical protein
LAALKPPLANVFLGSASASPGGSVHGICVGKRRAGGTEIRRLAGMAAPSAQPNGHLAAGQITRCPLQATSTTGDGSVFVTATR